MLSAGDLLLQEAQGPRTLHRRALSQFRDHRHRHRQFEQGHAGQRLALRLAERAKQLLGQQTLAEFAHCGAQPVQEGILDHVWPQRERHQPLEQPRIAVGYLHNLVLALRISLRRGHARDQSARFLSDVSGEHAGEPFHEEAVGRQFLRRIIAAGDDQAAGGA